MQDLLSVVISVHNMEQYLDRALQSVLAQTYHNLEIIIINNGSTDGSLEICEKYAKSDSRIKLVSQENQGLAALRRNSVKLASGKYLTFLDSDDYIDVDLYEKLMACCADFDIVICQWWRESEKEIRRSYDPIAPGAYSTPKDMDFLIRHLINISSPGGAINIQPGIAAYVWNKLFKTDLLRKTFDEIDKNLDVMEDRPITYTAMLRSKSVLITDICGYHYCIRQSSLGHSSDQGFKYIRTVCDFYDLMEKIFLKDPRYNLLMPQLQIKTAQEISLGIVKMGFEEEAQLTLKSPIFPYLNQLDGKRIVLYGADSVGQSYWRQIQHWKVCNIELWVDLEWEEYTRIGLPIEPVEHLLDRNYDYVVLALRKQEVAEHIKKLLLDMGIEETSILWRAPLT